MDLSKIITVKRSKNGRTKVYQTPDNEINTLWELKKEGYGVCTPDTKRIYFKTSSTGIELKTFDIIKADFRNMIEYDTHSNSPEGVGRNELIEWCLRDNPIRNNTKFALCLKSDLNAEYSHSLRMQADLDYRHEHEVLQMLAFLRNNKFQLTSDEIGTFQKNNTLYYKKTSKGDYILFNHFNQANIANSGFDAWLVSYKNAEHIGLQPPMVEPTQLQLSVDFNGVRDIIKDHV